VLHPATIAAQAGHYIDKSTGAITPPIQPSTTFARDNNYALIDRKHSYSRDGNPTYAQVEQVMATLEDGAQALLFASGMAAITALLQTLERGAHVVAPARMYYGTTVWLNQLSQRQDIQLSLVDISQPDSIGQAIVPGETRLVWIETPANPTWDIIDIAATAKLAHAAGAKVCVDSTVATPVHTKALNHGADMVFHSATKYLNGHSDLLAGVLVTKECAQWWQQICAARHDAGAVASAFEAWLLLRGLRTLFIRVHRASQSAQRIATHLEHHAKLERVLYPGLTDHPGHAIAKRQMQNGFGGMLSLCVHGGSEQAVAVANRLKLFVSATSLGGVESLVEHRATVEPPESKVPENLLRLSIGIEESEDLIADLDQALG